MTDGPPEFDELARLDALLRRLAYDRAAIVKHLVQSRDPLLKERLRRVEDEYQRVGEQMASELKRVQNAHGLSDEILDAIDENGLPVSDNRYWRTDMETIASTGLLDDQLPEALEALLPLADPAWLSAEARKSYRLDPRMQPIHLVSGVRLTAAERPQRFARMLLLAQDFVTRRNDLDFFEASALLPEVYMLGTGISMVPALGAEAERKLRELPSMSDELVASTVFELLVGIANIKLGRELEMLAPTKTGKTPDFRVTDSPVPTVIECKRRVSLGAFQLREAGTVEALFDAIRPVLRDAGAHIAVEAEFRTELERASPSEFVELVTEAAKAGDEEPHEMEWGSVRCVRLPYSVDMPPCRVSSPIFMERLFDWTDSAPRGTCVRSSGWRDWDGIVCEAEPLTSSVVRVARGPNCLKWRSVSQTLS